ncbi:MAG: hypothetical protein JWP89_1846 [Schlesneria sp.]|nr:hypothetical protein [Schlesneria sp.]
MTRCAVAVLLICLLGISGCSKAVDSPKTAPLADVAGTVTLDGKPMDEPEGTISFAAPGQPPAAFPIKGGKFEGKTRVGESRVEIRAMRVGGEPVIMDGKPVEGSGKVNYIAEQFNDQSTLTVDIKASGAKDLKYEVQSKP